MVTKVARIFIDRKELIGYTDMRLKRAKDKMTGELSFSVFMGWLPEEEVLSEANKGREVLVYVGGYLVFTGFIDRRRDTAKRSGKSGTTRTTEANGGTRNLSIGPDEYTVRFTARGKTKYLVDSSHQHSTGTMLKPTNRSIFEELVAPWGTSLEWEAEEIELDKIRFRDGGHVFDELQRVCEMTSLWMYETKDGNLKVQDAAGTTTGEPLILGQNILSFSTDQAENTEKSKVRVKGQRIEKGTWGTPAVIPTEEEVEDNAVASFIPLTVQLFGNATPQLINRRNQYEVNKRSAQSKQVSLDVFHLQQPSGMPWDIGDLHYVEIPPAGVYDMMEITELEYVVDNDKTLKTKLTLSPPPATVSASNTGDDGFLAGASDPSNSTPSYSGSAGDGWGGPELTYTGIPEGPQPAAQSASEAFYETTDVSGSTPPLSLPSGYTSQDE